MSMYIHKKNTINELKLFKLWQPYHLLTAICHVLSTYMILFGPMLQEQIHIHSNLDSLTEVFHQSLI